MSAAEQRIRELLHRIAREQNFQDYELQVSPISTGGANYSSLLYVATISGQQRDALHLFIKVAAMSEQMREKVSTVVFDTEKAMYTDVKQAYRKIEINHHVPEEHRLYLPEYYGADTSHLHEMLVLENMAVKGFVTHDRFKSIDWEYASKAVIELAKLHSLSIAFQREYPKEFQKLKDTCFVDWFTEDLFNTFFGSGVKHALDVLTEDNKKKYKKYVETKVDFATVKKHYLPLRVEVITHGDYRPSNLMHRTRDDGSLEIVAVDHQTMLIGSPIIDLLYLIFTGTDKEFRDQYFEKLVDFYYTQLSDALKRFDINPENTYSREDFYFELKEKLPAGLVSATYSLPHVTVEKAPELTGQMDLNNIGLSETGSLYPARMNGIVSDFVKWGVLT